MGDKFEKGTGRDIHAWMEFIQEHEDGAADLSALSHQQLAALASAGGCLFLGRCGGLLRCGGLFRS